MIYSGTLLRSTHKRGGSEFPDMLDCLGDSCVIDRSVGPGSGSETGHHLGGPPLDPHLPWITWQGQADYWAATTGMRRAFGSKAPSMTLKGARQLLVLQSERAVHWDHDAPDLSPECRYSIFKDGAAGLALPICCAVGIRGALQLTDHLNLW
jgi:hypothetical protein